MMSLRVSLLVVPIAVLIPIAAAQAQVYAGTDDQGVVVLSSYQSAESPDLLVAAPVAAPAAAPALPLGPMPIAAVEQIVQQVAREVAVSPHLLRAVIKVESGNDPHAVSRRGAQGLMQLMPDTARRFGALDAFDPHQNVQAGARYLKWLLSSFDGNLTLALAAYNAGEDAVSRYGRRVPPFAETRDYVPRVLALLAAPHP